MPRLIWARDEGQTVLARMEAGQQSGFEPACLLEAAAESPDDPVVAWEA